jgi:photosystem II stability/assembly factor-like uncharacterized protein
MNVGLNNLFIQSLAIDPSTPSTLYAGTYKSQVYKSQDGAKTWHWSGTGMQTEAVVYSLAIDSVSPARIYAATRGISNNGNPPWSGILYRSVDFGLSWTPILQDIGGAEAQDWVYSIAIHPTDTNSVYVATHEHGPFRSNEYGDADSWFAVHDGITDDSGRAIIINPDPADGTILYYGVWHWDSVYKTLDGGNDWFPANRDIPYTKVYSMAIDPLHPENVFLATFGRGIMKTIDGADTWQQSGLPDVGIYSIAIDPITSTNTIAGTAGEGVYSSMDGGINWHPASSGIQNSMATKVILSPTHPGQLFASIYGAGVYQSPNAGDSWSLMSDGLEDKFVHGLVINPAHPELLYAFTDTGGLFRYNLEQGSAWESIGSGLPIAIESRPAYPYGHPWATHDTDEDDTNASIDSGHLANDQLLTLTFAPAMPDFAYIGTGGSGVYRSIDGGLTWLSDGLQGETVQSLAVDYLDPLLVYAATTTAGSIKMTLKGGPYWTDIPLPVTFYDLQTSPSAPGSVYAGTDDGLYLYHAGSWTSLGLQGSTVTTIAIDPTRPDWIYAGTTSGAFFSPDAGNSWELVDENMENLTIRSIDFSSIDQLWVYFCTTTHGIFKAMIAH